MNWRLQAPIFFYSMFVLLTIPFSLVYLIRPEFMPYHAAAVVQNWAEIGPAFQNLILGLMKAVGAAWLSTAIAIIILIFRSLRQGMQWVYWAIPAIGLPPALVNSYVGITMALNTPASPPWEVLVLGMLLLLAGCIISMIPVAKTKST